MCVSLLLRGPVDGERGRPEACVIFFLSFDLGARQLLPIRAFAVD